MKTHALLTIITDTKDIDPSKFVIEHNHLVACKCALTVANLTTAFHTFEISVDTNEVFELNQADFTVTHPDCEISADNINLKVNSDVYLVVWHLEGEEPFSSMIEAIDEDSAWGKVVAKYESQFGWDDSEDIHLDHVKSLSTLHRESGIALAKVAA